LKALLGIAEEYQELHAAESHPSDPREAVEQAAEDDGKFAYSGGLVEVVKRDQPRLTERQQQETEQYGQSYEEANWAKLSPMFRERHNRLRMLRGLSPIPPPKIDLYKPPAVRRADPKELEALDREAKAVGMQFMTNGGKAPVRLMAPGREGFTIDGNDVEF